MIADVVAAVLYVIVNMAQFCNADSRCIFILNCFLLVQLGSLLHSLRSNFKLYRLKMGKKSF